MERILMLLDEYVELLNRDSKIVCLGYKIKDSIFRYLKEFLYFVNFVKYYDIFCGVIIKKGIYNFFFYE